MTHLTRWSESPSRQSSTLLLLSSFEMSFHHFLLWLWSMLKNSHYQKLSHWSFCLVLFSILTWCWISSISRAEVRSWRPKTAQLSVCEGASTAECAVWILTPHLFHGGCRAEPFRQLPLCLCESRCLCRTLNILSSNKGQHGLVRETPSGNVTDRLPHWPRQHPQLSEDTPRLFRVCCTWSTCLHLCSACFLFL